MIEAYGEGRIELPQPQAVANGGRSATVNDRPYTAETIAEFLSWGKAWKIKTALSASPVEWGNPFGCSPSRTPFPVPLMRIQKSEMR